MKLTTAGQVDSRNNGPALSSLRSAHRKRRRNGVRLLNVTVPETVIKDAIARGLLAAEAVTLLSFRKRLFKISRSCSFSVSVI